MVCKSGNDPEELQLFFFFLTKKFRAGFYISLSSFGGSGGGEGLESLIREEVLPSSGRKNITGQNIPVIESRCPQT